MSEDPIYLNQGHKKKQNHDEMYIDSASGNDWGEQASFTVGVSYVVASVIGIAQGGYQGIMKLNRNMPSKLKLNTIFNQLGKTQSTYGQAAASASLLYYLMGSSMNMFLEDELSGMSNLSKNVLCGALSGAVYKSTLGVVPMGVAAILGGGLIGGLTLVCDNLNKKGYIGFQMKF
ncbi:hypothetical protein PPERSA_10657 [Pseudocohnilembus persalinus]|uniref:Mitochondrial inner membrane translocase subunit Tim17/Tim22/Tim23/peroxisomal protein PMP24 n=1 Tax=Pseudocohnilembus persalinus TaxID=266149 RepID=A0A0V0QD85_PSEPJ|nr:hypothetical protein PPERSA_10657 [Pseudocohnilembus persalinus]|eukprot:KRX00158.1 hypothetical protein PPERSA_10657 [Pseudocohnilembus persalinus]